MTALARIDLPLLAKVCGMFGSTFDGERASAAARADQMVRKAGLSWSDLLQEAARKGACEDHRRSYHHSPGAILARFGHLLTGWEKNFLATLVRRPPPWSPRQVEILTEIQTRCAGEPT